MSDHIKFKLKLHLDGITVTDDILADNDEWGSQSREIEHQSKQQKHADSEVATVNKLQAEVHRTGVTQNRDKWQATRSLEL